MFELLNRKLPGPFEGVEASHNRRVLLKKFLSEYLALEDPLSDGEKVILVCHGDFIMALTSESIFEENRVNCFVAKNCQICPWLNYHLY